MKVKNVGRRRKYKIYQGALIRYVKGLWRVETSIYLNLFILQMSYPDSQLSIPHSTRPRHSLPFCCRESADPIKQVQTFLACSPTCSTHLSRSSHSSHSSHTSHRKIRPLPSTTGPAISLAVSPRQSATAKAPLISSRVKPS